MSRSRVRVTILGLMIAVALAVGTAILGLALSLHFGRIALPPAPVQPRDPEAIVVEADVKNWEPIFPDGPVDTRKPDRQINVVKGNVIIGQHNWIVRFKVARVVNGVFDSDEVHMLIHSPSEFGVRGPGQRFALCLSLRSEQPKVIASSSRRLARGLSYFSFAQPLYELVSADPRPFKPATTRKPRTTVEILHSAFRPTEMCKRRSSHDPCHLLSKRPRTCDCPG